MNKNAQETSTRWERKVIKRIVGRRRTQRGCVRSDPAIDIVIMSRRLQWLGHVDKMDDREADRGGQ